MDENKSFDYIPRLTLDPNAVAAAVQEAPAAVIEQAEKEIVSERPELESSLRPSRPR